MMACIWENADCHSELFAEKLAVYGECPLFPKADVQAPQKPLKLESANGHKETSTADLLYG